MSTGEMTTATQLQLFQIQDVIPVVKFEMDDWYTCPEHGNFELSHFFLEDYLRMFVEINGHIPCPYCLIEVENQEVYRRKNGS